MSVASRSTLLLIMVGLGLPGATAHGAGLPSRQAPPVQVARHQDLVQLNADHPVFAQPGADGPTVATVHAYRPLTGERTVLPLLATSRVLGGQLWLQVRLPGRGLGGVVPPPTGWILADAVTYRGTVWHIVIQSALHRALIFNTGRVIKTFSVINGKPSTPTPLGEYFVEENIELRHRDVGAPFALTTSARSAVLQEFAGGPGQIALHGLDHIGGRLGTAASHGCVRFSDDAITWLATYIVDGTPVTLM